MYASHVLHVFIARQCPCHCNVPAVVGCHSAAGYWKHTTPGKGCFYCLHLATSWGPRSFTHGWAMRGLHRHKSRCQVVVTRVCSASQHAVCRSLDHSMLVCNMVKAINDSLLCYYGSGTVQSEQQNLKPEQQKLHTQLFARRKSVLV